MYKYSTQLCQIVFADFSAVPVRRMVPLSSRLPLTCMYFSRKLAYPAAALNRPKQETPSHGCTGTGNRTGKAKGTPQGDEGSRQAARGRGQHFGRGAEP